MEIAVPDTLVLKIVEYDVNLDRPDTTLFILYDNKTSRYVIRGKRDDTIRVSCTYSYECKHSTDLVEFLEFLFDKNNKVSYILYNYDNLPATSNEITFEFLKKRDNMDYELSGYDNVKFKRKDIFKKLRMLKNIFNYY